MNKHEFCRIHAEAATKEAYKEDNPTIDVKTLPEILEISTQYKTH